MKLLITGGLGFIGSNLIRYLLEKYKDIQIINLDNHSYGSNQYNLKNIEDDRRYSIINGDIADPKIVKNIITKIDIIVNVAAETHVDRSISNTWSFFKSNVEGVLVLLEAIKSSARQIQFLQIGTDEVYSDIIEGSYNENDILNPSQPYSASKAAADLFVLAYNRTYNMNSLITRSTNNFGPFQFPEKLVPKTIVRAIKNMKIPIYGTGKNIRDWLSVFDHCEAIDLVLQKGQSNEIYNISSGNEFTNLEIVNRILEIMNKSKSLIEFVDDRPGHDLRYSLDSSKIRNKLGWRPKNTFDSALESTVDWYLSNEWWWKPIASERILHPTPWKLGW